LKNLGKTAVFTRGSGRRAGFFLVRIR